MNRAELKEIVIDQNRAETGKKLIARDVFPKMEEYANNPFIVIITGIRRSGKSTLLGQIREKHPGYYLNFDDDRLVKFSLDDFQVLYEMFMELYGEKDVFYFDEIQNVNGWERFVRRLHDRGKKVFVTGSNASMLSRELGTRLTGRHLPINLFPFSFREFLRLKGMEMSKNDVYLAEKKAAARRYFGEFLMNGGMPEYLLTGNKDYLKTLYENILYRDIIVRYRIANEKALKELVNLVSSNISKEISFNSIKKTLNLGSSTTVKDYFDYLENSFLVFLVPKFDYSLKKQIYSNKKVYFIDTALAAFVGYRTSKDTGRLLENLVFIELKRRGKDVYYHRVRRECDFLVKEREKVVMAVQVASELDEGNVKRETEGLVEAMDAHGLNEGLIITLDAEEERKLGNKTIKIMPAWKWLLKPGC